MDDRDRMLRKARSTNKDSYWSNYKQLKNRCNNMIKYAKQKYHHNLITKNNKNSRKFWKMIKEIFAKKNISTSSFTPSIIDKKITKANCFSSFFSSVAKTLKTVEYPLKNFVWGKP